MEMNTATQLFLILFLVAAATWTVYYFYFREQDKKSEKISAYVLGLKFMAEQDNRRAIEKFKQAVREDSDNIDAYMKLADILREEGLAGNAMRIHRDLVMRSDIGVDEKPKIEFSLALDYWQKEMFDVAEKYFKKLIDNKEYKNRAFPYLIKIYEKLDDYTAAVDLIEKSSTVLKEKYKSKLVILKVLQAENLIEKGEGKKARILLKDVLKIKSDSAIAVLYMGQSYIKEDRFEEALQVWTKFCGQVPSKAYILAPSLEKTYFDQGNFAQIQKLYENILKADPGNLPIYNALSKILRKKGDYESALALLSEARNLNLDPQQLDAEEVQILFELNKYKEAASLAIRSANGKSDIMFVCEKCGQASKEPFIKCNQCGNIDEPI